MASKGARRDHDDFADRYQKDDKPTSRGHSTRSTDTSTTSKAWLESPLKQ